MTDINMKIPVDQLQDRICPKCNGRFFVSAQTLKAIPMLYSPSNVPETMMIHVGFACVACGSVISLRPSPEELIKKVLPIDGIDRSRNVG